MVVEVFLAFFNLLLVQQAEMSQLAVGKAVYNGAAEVIGRSVVGRRTEYSPYGCDNHNEYDIQLAGCCTIGGRGHNEF